MKESSPTSAWKRALPLWLTLGIVAALAIRVAVVWSTLPETMASHFGVGGEGDAFMSKVGFFVFLVAVGGGSIAVVFVAPALLTRFPKTMINLPNRDYWLENNERRDIAIGRLRNWMGWFGFATAIVIVVAVELAIRANLERAPFANGPFIVVLAGYFLFTIIAVVWMMRAFAVPKKDASG